MREQVKVFFLGPILISDHSLHTQPIWRTEEGAEEHRAHCAPHVRDGQKLKVLRTHVDSSRIVAERVETTYLKSLEEMER